MAAIQSLHVLEQASRYHSDPNPILCVHDTRTENCIMGCGACYPTQESGRLQEDFRRTDNMFVLRSLTDKQRQTRQKGKASKSYCCFVDFRKALDTGPRAVLWQVLEKLGVCGRFLDVIKSLYACDSAAVRSSQGISAIFTCLTGVKQGCPLSPTLFGLYVDGLEQHLLETADIDAPTLMVVMVPLLLYANDLILMSESRAGLQKELDALASFYEQRQLTDSHSKTKVVVFEAQCSDVSGFVLCYTG